MITLLMAGISLTFLKLKKQRFFCKEYQSNFTAKTSIVETNCHISNQSKAMVIFKSAEAQSIKHHHHALPEILSFDEFKYAKGLMVFEYINAETGDILDILEERTSRVIKNHFIANYSLNDRRHVKTIMVELKE